MDAGAFSNTKVLESAKGIRFFLIDGTKAAKPIQKQYEVNSYPALVMCDPSGKAVDRMRGRDADGIAEQFRRLAADYTWSLPWITDLDKALKQGAEEKKPIVVWVPDNSKKSSMQLATFVYTPEVRKLFKDCVMLRGEHKRKSDFSERLGLSAGGVLMILDSTSEKPLKPVKRIRKAKSAAQLGKTLKKLIDKTKLEIRVRR